MATALEHYEALLADHYSWMLGDFEARVLGHLETFRNYLIEPHTSGVAIDLGTGSGAHAIALALLGFRVKAFDFSPKLAAEARRRAAGLPVEVIADDMLNVEAYGVRDAVVATCMGDTLTHLSSVEDVRSLFRAIHACLAPRGTFILTFRDLTSELRGTDRFFLVRADESTIFTCFLEYEAERVMVHDIVHVKTRDGWKMQKSAYPKLRLAKEDVMRWLNEDGFNVDHVSEARGMVEMVMRSKARPSPSELPPW
jgi:SAM-dependent methyltransferase